jgi:hypothetical protein
MCDILKQLKTGCKSGQKRQKIAENNENRALVAPWFARAAYLLTPVCLSIMSTL